MILALRQRLPLPYLVLIAAAVTVAAGWGHHHGNLPRLAVGAVPIGLQCAIVYSTVLALALGRGHHLRELLSPRLMWGFDAALYVVAVCMPVMVFAAVASVSVLDMASVGRSIAWYSGCAAIAWVFGSPVWPPAVVAGYGMLTTLMGNGYRPTGWDWPLAAPDHVASWVVAGTLFVIGLVVGFNPLVARRLALHAITPHAEHA